MHLKWNGMCFTGGWPQLSSSCLKFCKLTVWTMEFNLSFSSVNSIYCLFSQSCYLMFPNCTAFKIPLKVNCTRHKIASLHHNHLIYGVCLSLCYGNTFYGRMCTYIKHESKVVVYPIRRKVTLVNLSYKTHSPTHHVTITHSTEVFIHWRENRKFESWNNGFRGVSSTATYRQWEVCGSCVRHSSNWRDGWWPAQVADSDLSVFLMWKRSSLVW